jgi:hypothetical protein
MPKFKNAISFAVTRDQTSITLGRGSEYVSASCQRNRFSLNANFRQG